MIFESEGQMIRLACFAALVSIGPVGCSKGTDKDSGSLAAAPDDLNRSRVEISSAQVISGFKHGALRQEIDVAEFSISRHPVTMEQFRTCVDEGPCTEPTSSCAESDGHDEDAALCVGADNAQAYCSWSGGRLPTLNEWFLAARGRSPQRFSWGDGAPSCEQHPLARVSLADRAASEEGMREVPEDETECGESRELLHRVGRHVAGASPSGVEDILLVSGELLAGHRDSNFGVCRDESKPCLVYGLIPGSIDSVRENSGDEDAIVFRCVWSEEGA